MTAKGNRAAMAPQLAALRIEFKPAKVVALPHYRKLPEKAWLRNRQLKAAGVCTDSIRIAYGLNTGLFNDFKALKPFSHLDPANRKPPRTAPTPRSEGAGGGRFSWTRRRVFHPPDLPESIYQGANARKRSADGLGIIGS